MKVLVFIMAFVFTSCTPLEVLPGLCYTDKEGTYLCQEMLEIPVIPIPKQKELNCNEKGLIEYCQDKKFCHCVDHNDMDNMTDFLWSYLT